MVAKKLKKGKLSKSTPEQRIRRIINGKKLYYFYKTKNWELVVSLIAQITNSDRKENSRSQDDKLS